MTPQAVHPEARVHASVSLGLNIPADVAAKWLKGTVYEGRALGQEPEHDREAIGELLGERIAEELSHLLDYLVGDLDVEADW